MSTARSFVTKLTIACACFVVILGTIYTPTYAAEPKSRGLFISPLRTYAEIDAGDQKTRSFRVANLTKTPITITLSVESFSMADDAYNYNFTASQNDWLRISQTIVKLAPNQSQEIAYALTIPKNAPPGGQYYTIFASADLSDNGVESTVRATTLVYVTVNGKLTYSSQLKNQSLPRVVWTPQFNYSLDVLDTGNTHYFAHFESRLEGLWYTQIPSGTSYLLMPGMVRHVQDTFNSPLLPGIYLFTYGYTTDTSNAATAKYSKLIVFIPPWFIITILVVGFGSYKWYRVRRRKNKKYPARSTDS